MGLAVVGVARLAAGDRVGLVYLAAGLAALVFLPSRYLPSAVWAATALWALAGLVRGDLSDVLPLVVGLAATAFAVSPGAPLELRLPHAAAERPGVPPEAPPSRPVADPTTALEGLDSSAPLRATVAVEPPAETRAAPAPEADAPDVEASEGGLETVAGELVELSVLGTFSVILSTGEDIADRLLHKRVLCFIWLHLLVQTLYWDRGRWTRDALGDTANPNLASSVQMGSVRRQINAFRRYMPAALTSRLEVGNKLIAFSLAGVRVDLLELRALAAEVGKGRKLLDAALLARVEAELRRLPPDVTLLPIWEDAVKAALRTKAPARDERIDSLRAEAERLRSDLAAAVGFSLQLQGDHRGAIPWLKEALRLGPEGTGVEEIAEAVVAGHQRLGESKKAEEFRQAWAQGEVV